MKKDMKKKKGRKNYKAGGLKMVEKDGKKVPFFAADGKGKMMGGGKVMRYAEGDMVDMAGAAAGMAGAGAGMAAGAVPTIKPPEGPMKRRPTAKEREEGFKGTDLPPSERPKKKKNKKKKNMKGGGMMKYGHGGGVKGGKPRGCGVARQGVRNAKMVVMKGS